MSKIVQDISILRQKSENVTSVEEAKSLISELEAELKQLDNGIGLAAIQLGYPKRVGVIKKKDGSWFHLINPELLEGLEEFIFVREGCLSFPNIYRDTKRYRQIMFKHQRIVEDKFEDETLVAYYSTDGEDDGLTAIAIQHELDHFDGRLILDHNVVAESIVRTEPKVGRNDKCPCGSGKKYKKCCQLTLRPIGGNADKPNTGGDAFINTGNKL